MQRWGGESRRPSGDVALHVGPPLDGRTTGSSTEHRPDVILHPICLLLHELPPLFPSILYLSSSRRQNLYDTHPPPSCGLSRELTPQALQNPKERCVSDRRRSPPLLYVAFIFLTARETEVADHLAPELLLPKSGSFILFAVRSKP